MSQDQFSMHLAKPLIHSRVLHCKVFRDLES